MKYMTEERQKLHNKVYRRKYGKGDHTLMINDRELSKISGYITRKK